MPMTVPHARHQQILPRPACTPAAIRAVLAAAADSDVLRRFDAELDAAYERSRADGDLAPLTETVRRWWFEADAWRDPDARREFAARVDSYLREGPPPVGQRVNRQEVRARFGV
jgi:Family of unknown function (DUF6247)